MEKAAVESERGATVVCLVPARTDTKWWHEQVMARASEVRLVRRRLKFGAASRRRPFRRAHRLPPLAGGARRRCLGGPCRHSAGGATARSPRLRRQEHHEVVATPQLGGVPGKRRIQSKAPTLVSTAERKSRVRYGPLPELPVEVAIGYANTRDGALTPAEAVRAMLDSDAWRDVMIPELEALEDRRRNANKVQPVYTCEELESVYLYQQVAGLDTVGRTREQLTSHAGAQARRLLGFDRPRRSKSQVTQIHAVPSEATLSRYRLAWAPSDAGRVVPATKDSVATGDFPTVYDFKRAEADRRKAAIAARAEVYVRLFARWVAEYAKTPEAAEGSRALFMDGTALNTYFDCLITNKGVPQNDKPRALKRCRVKPVLDECGKVVWNGLMSDERWSSLVDQDKSFRRYWAYSADGGFGASNSPSRSGHGYSIVNIVDSSGLPIDFIVAPINPDETTSGAQLLDRLAPTLGLFPQNGVRVFGADSGFTGYPVRSRIRALGMLENIHVVSGAPSDRSKNEREKRRAEQRRIPYFDPKTGKGHKKWHSNGLFELFCDCGRGEVQKRFRHDQNGKLIPSIEGQCRTCGPITITSGHWAYKSGEWDKVITSNHLDEPELAFGNPLTFDSPIAKAYGRRRFALQEGVHSILSNRFGLTRGRRRMKYADEARLQTAMTFSVMHLLADVQRRGTAVRARTRSSAPPGAPAQAAA